MELIQKLYKFRCVLFFPVMRLGKKKEKEKDTEPRSQNVEGVSRLICSARAAHTSPLKGRKLLFALHGLKVLFQPLISLLHIVNGATSFAQCLLLLSLLKIHEFAYGQYFLLRND